MPSAVELGHIHFSADEIKTLCLLQWSDTKVMQSASNPQVQTQSSFVCVSDIDEGYTDTPRTRRVKTVFCAIRHAT